MKHLNIHRALAVLCGLAVSSTAFAIDLPNTLEPDQPVLNNLKPTDVHIPLDTKLIKVPAATPDITSEKPGLRKVEPLLEYALAGRLDANFGLISPQYDPHFASSQSGGLPEGRYVEPVRSKFGAGVSRKF